MVKVLDLLKSIDVFEQLSNDDLQQVVSLVRETRVDAGAVVARQGEAGDALYVVSSGRLQTNASDGTDGGRPVAECLQGQWLGEMALLTGEPWGFTVTAATESTLLMLRKEEFDTFLGTSLHAMVQAMKVIAKRQAARQAIPPETPPQPVVPPVEQTPSPETPAQPVVLPVEQAPSQEASPQPVASSARQAPPREAPYQPIAQPDPIAPAVPTSPPEPVVRVDVPPPPTVAWIPRPAGKLFTVFSPKGGSGKSTVAVNLAVAMAKAHPQSVALLDLSLTFGHDMLMLNLVPRSSLAATTAEALRKLGLDEDLSHYLAVHPSSGLRVMAGAVHPEDGETVSADSTKAAIEMLRLHFPYVVVDTGSNFTDPVLCALEASDRVLMLCSPEISVLRDIQECRRILGEVIHLSGDRLLYLLNSLFPFKTIPKEQFVSALHQELVAELPYGGDVPAKAALRGEAFVETQSGSPLARAIQRLAAQLTEDGQRGSDLQRQDRKRGFFR